MAALSLCWLLWLCKLGSRRQSFSAVAVPSHLGSHCKYLNSRWCISEAMHFGVVVVVSSKCPIYQTLPLCCRWHSHAEPGTFSQLEFSDEINKKWEGNENFTAARFEIIKHAREDRRRFQCRSFRFSSVLYLISYRHFRLFFFLESRNFDFSQIFAFQ